MAVQTETYANIQARVEALIGDTLTTTERTRLKALVNRRARLAYKRYDKFPSFFIGKEQRRVNGDGGIEHVHVDHNGDDTGLNHVDEIYQAWPEEPFTNSYGAGTLDIYEQDDTSFLVGYENTYTDTIDNSKTGFDLSSLTLKSGLIVAITNKAHTLKVGDDFKIDGSVAPEDGLPSLNDEFTVSSVVNDTQVQATISYSGTSKIYTVTDADLFIPQAWISYRKRYADTYGDGDGETSTVPHEWADYLVQSAYADFLRADGQTDKARSEEIIAETILNEEMWKQDRKLSKWEVVSTVRTHASEANR